jgi:hypothetical protein
MHDHISIWIFGKKCVKGVNGISEGCKGVVIICLVVFVDEKHLSAYLISLEILSGATRRDHCPISGHIGSSGPIGCPHTL